MLFANCVGLKLAADLDNNGKATLQRDAESAGKN